MKSESTEAGLKKWLTFATAVNCWRNNRKLLEAYVYRSEEAIREGTGRRSFRYDELNPKFLYDMPSEPFINYLEFVNDYLESSENAENEI